MILGGFYPDDYVPPRPAPEISREHAKRILDRGKPAQIRMLDVEPVDTAPTCGDCGAAIHDGNTCIECWRDRRELAIARDREWWSA